MVTYRVPVIFSQPPNADELSKVDQALGDDAGHEMTVADGLAASAGRNPVYFYLVVDSPDATGVFTPTVSGEQTARAIMARALLDAGYTLETATIDHQAITRAAP